MNKQQAIRAVSTRAEVDEQTTRRVLETFFDVVVREVAAGGTVSVAAFGSFERVEKAARVGRNPRKGEGLVIPPTLAPKFRPFPAFREFVADPQLLPDRPVGQRKPRDRAAA